MADQSREKNFEIRIPPSGYRELAAIAQNSVKLEQIIKVASEIGLTAGMGKLSANVAERVGIDVPTSSLILEGVLNLHSTMARIEITAIEVVAAITDTIGARASEAWKKANLENWTRVRGVLQTVLDQLAQDESLSSRQKARVLTFAHQKVLTDGSLITDLRPVFNKAGDKILQMVVTHALLIEYMEDGETKRVEFALDNADVGNLKKICERGQLKVQTVRESLKALPYQVHVPPDDASDK